MVNMLCRCCFSVATGACTGTHQVLQNLRDGRKKLRLLDIKIGQQLLGDDLFMSLGSGWRLVNRSILSRLLILYNITVI